MAEDFHKILGLSPGASKAEIKRAYHQLAKQYHPDHNTGDPEAEKKFHVVSEAYKALTDSAQVHYSILGVGRTSSISDVKRAYARIAESLQPAIRNGDKAAAERLERAKQAYSHLAGQEDELGGGDNNW